MILKILSLFFFISLYSQQIVRVNLIESDKPIQLQFKHAGVLYANEGRYQFTKKNEPTYVFAKDGFIYVESKGNYPRSLKYKPDSNVYFKVPRDGNSILIDNTFKEEGPLYFQITKTGKLRIVLHSPIQRYLEYVVPNEIIAKKDKHYEAIKAQTVTARSYVMSKADITKPFDVYSDTRDQMFRSNIAVPDLVKNAVRETDGIVLRYLDEILQTKYCSTLGGRRAYPSYLSGDSVFLEVTDPEGNYFGKSSPLYRWEREFDVSLIHLRLQKWFPDQFAITDTLSDIPLTFAVKERDVSGRAIHFTVSNQHHEIQLKALDIRRFFHTKNNILPSNLFTFSLQNNRLIFSGGGFGHGEGMGQYEALEMAERRYNFLQILDYFYPKSEAMWLEY